VLVDTRFNVLTTSVSSAGNVPACRHDGAKISRCACRFPEGLGVRPQDWDRI